MYDILTINQRQSMRPCAITNLDGNFSYRKYRTILVYQAFVLITVLNSKAAKFYVFVESFAASK